MNQNLTFFFFFWLAILILTSTINQLNLPRSIGFPSQRPLYRMAGCFLLETVPVSLWSRWQVNWVQVGRLDNAILSDIFQQEVNFIGHWYHLVTPQGYLLLSIRPVATDNENRECWAMIGILRQCTSEGLFQEHPSFQVNPSPLTVQTEKGMWSQSTL